MIAKGSLRALEMSRSQKLVKRFRIKYPNEVKMQIVIDKIKKRKIEEHKAAAKAADPNALDPEAEIDKEVCEFSFCFVLFCFIFVFVYS